MIRSNRETDLSSLNCCVLVSLSMVRFCMFCSGGILCVFELTEEDIDCLLADFTSSVEGVVVEE